MLWERSKPCGSILHSWKSWGHPLSNCLFPYRRNHEALSSLKLWWLTWCSQSQTFFLQTRTQSNLYILWFDRVLELLFWNSGLPQSTLIRRPLPKVGFCSCSWTAAMRGWNQFTTSCRYHSWYWNLSAYYLCIGWEDFSQVSWYLSDAGSSNSHFYSWIDGKFLCCRGTKTWDVYAHGRWHRQSWGTMIHSHGMFSSIIVALFLYNTFHTALSHLLIFYAYLSK